jgi:hypothetical protein
MVAIFSRQPAVGKRIPEEIPWLRRGGLGENWSPVSSLSGPLKLKLCRALEKTKNSAKTGLPRHRVSAGESQVFCRDLEPKRGTLAMLTRAMQRDGRSPSNRNNGEKGPGGDANASLCVP